jgi:hypothetical protein
VADQRITQLTQLTEADVAAADVLPIVDISASETKKVTAKDLFEAGAALADAASIDLTKLDQSSTTKLGTTALADDAITAAKLANDSSINYGPTEPSADNFEGRGHVNSTTKYLKIYDGSVYQQVIAPTAGIENLAITTGKLAANAVTTAKVDASGLGTAAIADSAITAIKIADGTITSGKFQAGAVDNTAIGDSAVNTAELAASGVTYAKIQNVSAADKLLGRATAGAGIVEEITCTSAGRALLDDADASAQRTTLGLGTVATQDASAVAITGGTISGVSSLTSTTSSLGNATITAGSITGITDLAVADGGTGASDAGTARTNLGVAIGTNVQAYDAGLQSIAGLTTSANQTVYTTASDTYETTSLTSFGRSLIDDADAATARTTLGLGTLATQSGTFTGTHSGTSSGSNTGDQTIALTGEVTGSGTGSFAATIADNAITTAKVADGAITTAELGAGAVTGAKLAASSSTIVSGNAPSFSGDFTGQQWVNTGTGLAYTWTGSAWVQQAGVQTFAFADSTPLNFSAAVSSAGLATITSTLDTQVAATVFAGPTTGSNATPTFRSLTGTDLPIATASVNGAIQPGTGLAVTGAGVLNHSNSATPGTYTKVTIDAQGHVSSGAGLLASDVPSLDASKLTSGTLAPSLYGTNSITGIKLADYSTVKFGGAGSTSGVVTFPSPPEFIGQGFFDSINSDYYLWDGNAWRPLTVISGDLIYAGTYNASSNTIATVTTSGTAAGLVVGNALPAASVSLSRFYVVVSVNGTGTAPAPTVALAAPDMLICSGTSWDKVGTSSTVAGVSTATGISVTPYGNIAATNVQTAIQELEDEKLAKVGGVITGELLIGTAGTFGFEGSTANAYETYLSAVDPTADRSIVFPDQSGTVIVSGNASIVNADINASAAIAYSKLSLGTSIVNADISSSAAIAGSKIVAATTSIVGAVQLSDSTSTTSSALAATPTAVKAAYDLAAAALPKAGGIITGNLEIGTSGSLTFEGATGDAFETTLTVVDPTVDRTITLPDATGTVITTGDTGTITSTMIANNTILDADINANAEIAVSKLADGTARQLLQTDAAGTGVEWTSNIDIPGTLDVTSAATFDSSVAVTGALTKSGNNVVTVGDTGTVTSTMLLDGTILNADINASAAIVDTKLATIATAGKVSNSATTAVSTNTASAIVARDASGNFSAGTITASLTGNASTVTTNANLTGDVTSVGNATAIAAGVIVDADINANAEIAVSKLADGAARQLLQTDAAGTGVEWASNIDIPGTLDVTGTSTFDSDAYVYGVRVGRGAGAQVSNTVVGNLALNVNTTGFQNTAVGANVLRVNNNGNYNTGVGLDALYSNTNGSANVAMGLNALRANTSGESNTAIGVNTLLVNVGGNYNTAIGQNALTANTTGINNTAIGINALASNVSGSYNVGIGPGVSSSSSTVSNEVNIYNGSVTARFQGAASAWNFVSDARDKTDIQDLTLGLEFISALKPRRFKWNLRNSKVDIGKPSAGFIAQEVLQAVERFSAPYTNLIDTNDPNQYTFAQANMIPILVKAVQELTIMVKDLQTAARLVP